jgi:hypothetical protein
MPDRDGYLDADNTGDDNRHTAVAAGCLNGLRVGASVMPTTALSSTLKTTW